MHLLLPSCIARGRLAPNRKWSFWRCQARDPALQWPWWRGHRAAPSRTGVLCLDRSAPHPDPGRHPRDSRGPHPMTLGEFSRNHHLRPLASPGTAGGPVVVPGLCWASGAAEGHTHTPSPDGVECAAPFTQHSSMVSPPVGGPFQSCPPASPPASCSCS